MAGGTAVGAIVAGVASTLASAFLTGVIILATDTMITTTTIMRHITTMVDDAGITIIVIGVAAGVGTVTGVAMAIGTGTAITTVSGPRISACHVPDRSKLEVARAVIPRWAAFFYTKRPECPGCNAGALLAWSAATLA
jgi:hypothetical protein